MNTLTIVGIVAGAIILLTVILLAMYVKAPPSVAYILSGLRKEPRVLIGTGGFKVPVIERLHYKTKDNEKNKQQVYRSMR